MVTLSAGADGLAGNKAIQHPATISTAGNDQAGAAAPAGTAGTRASTRLGTGELINTTVAEAGRPTSKAAGKATFNFEGEPLQAVVKVILGDLLGHSYVVAPGVQGTVTLVAESVNEDQALSLLEMVLSWNNAALVWSDGRYNVVPTDKAVSGGLVPRAGTIGLSRGFEARAFPLKFVSATEMEKILKPYARDHAVVHVDRARNLIVLAGTRAEIANYAHTIQIFDVDWLAGMSVGIFPLRSASPVKMVAQLEQVFGEKGGTPIAGMVRFLPIEDTGSILVITPQAKYLKDVEDWIARLDASGEGIRLYTYEARYLAASDLGERLSQIFSGARTKTRDKAPSLAPGLSPVTLREVSASSSDTAAAAADDSSTAIVLRASRRNEVGDGIQVAGGEFAVSTVEESNSLLIRTTPSQWSSILMALERLDTMPLQVHIEAQIVEVSLQNELEYGVSWFFENSIANGGGLRDQALGRTTWGSISGALDGNGVNWSWLGRNALATIKALDAVSDVKVLSTPSVFVQNNAEAELNVGQNIPITTTSFAPIDGGSSGGDGTFQSVQYLQTGVILRVKPRISGEGMVFMEISQEVSTPVSEPTEEQPNVSVATKNLQTKAAVRSGETVMLAGLITDTQGTAKRGLPLLSRLPLVGGVFGSQSRSKNRSEVVIFITPRVIRDTEEARQRTLDYTRRFERVAPLVVPDKQ